MKVLTFLITFLMGFLGHSQCIYINEIMINGAACDGSCNPNTSEWVELYNDCGSAVDLSCYIISDGDWALTLPSGTSIPAGGYLTIGGASNEGSAPDLLWDGANYSGTGGIGTFTNGGEQLVLFAADGTWVDGIYWGGGQGLPDASNAVTASGSCGITNVSLPSTSDSKWEDIGGDGSDGSTMARECDGANTWVNMEGSDMTFGENNGCIPLFLDTTRIIYPKIEEEVVEKVIIHIFTINGKEVLDFGESGIYIVVYDDYTRKRVGIIK